jgi:alkylhydroperoxidase/carboxymuconolactone decarboxylase family protein YurZ
MTLDPRERRRLRLFVACVLGRWDEVVRIRRAVEADEPDRAWRETVLQVHVFAGFPRLVEAYGVLAEAGGLGAREPGEESAGDDAESLAAERARGRALFDRIYAADATRVRAMLESHDRDFASWIEGHAYGRVLARPGLAADRRELLAVVALAALGQDRQLASHARGSLRLGASPSELVQALDVVADLIDAERLERARRVVERFAGESGRA